MKKILCSSFLLITKRDDIGSVFYTVASTLGVEDKVTVTKEIPADIERFSVIVSDVSIAKKAALPERTRVILFDEKVGKLIDRYDSFIYNVSDPLQREIFMSFYVSEDSTLLEQGDPELEDSLTKFGTSFEANFARAYFRYKGKEVYLTKAEQRYVYSMLVCFETKSKDRYVICRLRKKFGKEFPV